MVYKPGFIKHQFEKGSALAGFLSFFFFVVVLFLYYVIAVE